MIKNEINFNGMIIKKKINTTNIVRHEKVE